MRRLCRCGRVSLIVGIYYSLSCIKLEDALFEAFISDGDACEELLQVILDNPGLRIDRSTLVPQKTVCR